MLRCYVCGNPEVIILTPKPLCQWHETEPETPLGASIGAEGTNDWDDIPEYLQDLDTPVYPA